MPEKLVLGVASYGRSYELANPLRREPGAETVGIGLPGTFTAESGVLSYFEVWRDLWLN